jgi:hypothetical protein
MSVATQTTGRTAQPVTARVISALLALWAAFLELAEVVDSHLEAQEPVDTQGMTLAQSVSAKAIGKGLMTVALVVIVLNQLFTLSIINNSSGPFSGLISTVENLGTAALTLVVIGFIVLGASVAMSYMDRF